MEAQSDFETESVLAIFHSAEDSAEGVRQLEAAAVPKTAITRVVLAPGHYQADDCTLSEEAGGAGKGAIVGTPLGAALGLGLAAAAAGGDAPTLAGLAVAGSAGGFILGSFVGAITRTHFDDDEAASIDVPEGSAAYLVMVDLPGALSRQRAHIRQLLTHAGAAAFLDCSLPEVDQIVRRAHTELGLGPAILNVVARDSTIPAAQTQHAVS